MLTEQKGAFMSNVMKKVLTFIVLNLALSSTVVLAQSVDAIGGESSGGGGGFYCSATDQTELLDTWEGRNLYGYTIPSSNVDVQLQLNQALLKLQKIAPHISDKVKFLVSDLQTKAIPLPAGVELAFPHDALPDFQKSNCQLRGLMFFDGSRNVLRYDAELVKKLTNNTDIAALWMHEAVYKTLRDDFQETNSKASRKIVACLFSSKGCLDNLKTLEQMLPTNRNVYRCGNQAATYFMYANANNKIALIITRLNGKDLKYPAYNSNTIYNFPTKADYPNLMIATSFEPTEQSTDYLYFQSMEGTNFKITTRNHGFKGNSGEDFRPFGTLGSKYIFNDSVDVFKINNSINNCIQY